MKTVRATFPGGALWLDKLRFINDCKHEACLQTLFTMNYISLTFLLFCNFFASTALVLDDGKLPRQTFKAAVYEHFAVLPPNRQTKVYRDVALANMMKNLEVYKIQADAAGRMRVWMGFTD